MLGYALWLGLWAGRARNWGVLGVAVVYAGLSLAVWLGSSAANPVLFEPLWLRSLQMAAVGVPALAFWVMCGWAIWQRQWSRLNWLLVGSMVAALLAAAPMLWNDWQERVLDEPYAWSGAYMIWFVGVTVAGLAGLVIFGSKKVVQWIRRWRTQKILQPTTV
jgi:fucose 4-O-acetylase-like acetyltransferase